jgi:hypothetical protein
VAFDPVAWILQHSRGSWASDRGTMAMFKGLLGGAAGLYDAIVYCGCAWGLQLLTRVLWLARCCCVHGISRLRHDFIFKGSCLRHI